MQSMCLPGPCDMSRLAGHDYDMLLYQSWHTLAALARCMLCALC